MLGAFPTVVFAALSALSLCYWLLVLVGALDLDALDAVSGKTEGAVKGVIEGAADAVAGTAKGGASAIAEALSALGLTKVPVTISFSSFSILGFLLSATTRHFLDGSVPGFVSALVAAVVASVGAFGLTTLITRPLAPVFDDSLSPQGGDTLIGKTCRVTIDADHSGGQAQFDEGNIIVTVRVIAGKIAAGEEAIILDRQDDGVFVVEPLKAHLPSQQDAFAQLQHNADTAAAATQHTSAPALPSSKKHPED